MVSIQVEGLSLSYPVARGRLSSLRLGPGTRFKSEREGYFVRALKDITFSIEAGNRVGIIGSNGSGKTTLLKVLHGIYRPSAGNVLIDGRTDALFNVGLGFRQQATGRRNIELRGLINGWSEEQIAGRMEEIIAYSELGEFIDMPYKTYSQGMAARLAFASATAFQPEILLMDEWIGAGDPSFQKKAKERMTSLIKEAGIVMIASHNVSILKSICDKGLLLDKGELVFFGDLEEALERHRGSDSEKPVEKPE